MDHLKQLWAQKRCVKKQGGNAMSTISKTMVAAWAVNAALWIAPVGAADAPAVRPGDEAMTCEQIATELSPYVQQMAPNIQALGMTQQQLYAQGRLRSRTRPRQTNSRRRASRCNPTRVCNA
jgi:pyruvate/2-oxoglutarate dehydrogenase complex dihydrolipoamide dehydrogenase (E3) component